MNFTGFSPAALDLLVENRIQNNKDFYETHKSEIKTLIWEPLTALADMMAPTMEKIDPTFVIDHRRMLSRIRRDTRFTKDKSLYRDHVWITFARMRQERFSERPGYHVEISPDGFNYGCGYYRIPPAEMQIARNLILSRDKIFLEAFHAVNQTEFVLYGEDYKRPKHPDEPAEFQIWLNKKNLGISYSSTNFTSLFDGSFVDVMLERMEAVAPFYSFLCHIKQRAHTAGIGGMG